VQALEGVVDVVDRLSWTPRRHRHCDGHALDLETSTATLLAWFIQTSCVFPCFSSAEASREPLQGKAATS
jgi:hypothetical protein